MTDLTPEELTALEALLAKATPGPYIVRSDDAIECGPHANSGLATIETHAVKSGSKFHYWPIVRLGEWPTTHYVCNLLNAAPALIAAARKEQKMREALIEVARQCEDHPTYFPDATDADIHREGGDCAFVTWLAHIAREALK